MFFFVFFLPLALKVMSMYDVHLSMWLGGTVEIEQWEDLSAFKGVKGVKCSFLDGLQLFWMLHD